MNEEETESTGGPDSVEADSNTTEVAEAAEAPASIYEKGDKLVASVIGNNEFLLRKPGLYFVKKEEGKKKLVLLSGPICIVAETRDRNNDNWGRILEFEDRDGKRHRVHVLMADLIPREGEEVIAELVRRGLPVKPGKEIRRGLVAYIQNGEGEGGIRKRAVDATGWLNDSLGAFILPDTSISADGNAVGEEAIWTGSDVVLESFESRGTLEDWQQVAKLSEGNSRLVFAISSALAGPLLLPLNEDGGGFNLVGASSIGKSSALRVAASVIGKPSKYVQSWRATSNGLEGIARQHNDLLLILDELGQVSAKEAGDIVYMLANGTGKQRAGIRGDARKKVHWKVLVLASGEVTLRDQMKQAGKNAHAGQENRLADIPADAGKGLGLFDDTKGHDAARFAEMIKELAANAHGTALRAFIRAFQNDPGAVGRAIELRDKFIKANVAPDAPGQIKRLAGRFGLVAAAGELASGYGITGWKEEEAFKAAQACFRAQIEERGGTEQQEEMVLVANLEEFLQKHGTSRFSLMDDRNGRLVDEEARPVVNRAGFRILNDKDESEYALLSSAFREICGNLPPKRAAKILREKGLLIPGNETSMKTLRLPQMGPTKIYHISSKATGGQR